MGPGLYSDIGKKARDLLYRDFQTDQKFTLTTYASNGAIVQSRIGQLYFLLTVYLWLQAELQYLHEYTGISASVGLNSKPLVNLSGVVGNKVVAVGADVAYDTATGNLTKYNAGFSVTNADLIAAVTLNNKGDSLTGSYYHLVNAGNNTAVGAEMTHSFSSNQNTITFGSQHALDPSTTVKARYNNHGLASALIQHEWRPKSFFTLSTEVDTKAIEKSSKVGVSLVLKP
ncbi:hypothetical protein PR202_gb04984 [Eleusine coracana subsp. coracana]|uniref:Uncharacterized protein n=1 Tax=Eleusine coracana subsp. coracana TaxID=191504 RepID=A0AAV5E3F5_ELECO|nr:hypothetical protein PR202_gb04984 [Eleusine coracana subsp. coracana]